jgi:hypothetical protein
VEWSGASERCNQLLYLVLYFISHINAKDPQLCSHKHNRGSENVYHTRVQAGGGGATRLYIYHSTSHTSVSCRCSTVTHVPSMQAIPYLPTRAAQAGGGNFKLQTSVVPTSSHNSHSESNGLCRFTVATPPNLLKPIKSTATENTL